MTIFGCERSRLNFNQNSLEDSKIYLAYRGTNTKEGYFAKQYNLEDTLSTHVGILFHTNYNWKIFHIIDSKGDMSDLKEVSLSQFYDYELESTISGSIWELSSLSKQAIMSIKKRCHDLMAQRIEFDKEFDAFDSSKLYCSEFVRNILCKSDSVQFKFRTIRTHLKPIHAFYLKKEFLDYYPIDMFQAHENINLLAEWIN